MPSAPRPGGTAGATTRLPAPAAARGSLRWWCRGQGGLERRRGKGARWHCSSLDRSEGMLRVLSGTEWSQSRLFQHNHLRRGGIEQSDVAERLVAEDELAPSGQEAFPLQSAGRSLLLPIHFSSVLQRSAQGRCYDRCWKGTSRDATGGRPPGVWGGYTSSPQNEPRAPSQLDFAAPWPEGPQSSRCVLATHPGRRVYQIAPATSARSWTDCGTAATRLCRRLTSSTTGRLPTSSASAPSQCRLGSLETSKPVPCLLP